MIRAWSVRVQGFDELSIRSASTRGQAEIDTFLNAREAGYNVKIREVSAHRSPTHDHLCERREYLGHIDRRGEFHQAVSRRAAKEKIN